MQFVKLYTTFLASLFFFSLCADSEESNQRNQAIALCRLHQEALEKNRNDHATSYYIQLQSFQKLGLVYRVMHTWQTKEKGEFLKNSVFSTQHQAPSFKVVKQND